MRILITLPPRMYREAIALAIHQHRPGLVEVRVAPPEAAEGELAGFRPHLLVHADADPIPAGALAGVPCRVEVLYSDSMDARVISGDGVREARDMSMEGLLRAVDGAAALVADREVGREAGSPG